ncbi:hypothetical protein JNJ66_00325 [Candidatus Saccharibacteria bacterium]|nr:hypothetical protein [Candidatus Saccharibacteria bacterium]
MKNLIRTIPVLLLLTLFSSLVLAGLSSRPAGASATHIPLNVTSAQYIPNRISAHRDGSVTGSSCSPSSYPWTYLKTYASNNQIVTGLEKANTSDWMGANCNDQGIATGHDNTVYMYENRYLNSSTERRLAAYKDDVLLWAKSFVGCNNSNSNDLSQAELYYPTLGFDNTLYVFGFAQSDCTDSNKNNALYALDLANGDIVSQAQVYAKSPINSSDSSLIVPMEDGVAFLDHEIIYTNGQPTTDRKFMRYYGWQDGLLVENTNRAYDISNVSYSARQYVSQLAGDPEGNIYVQMYPDSQPYNNCTGSTEIVRLDQSQSSPALSRVPLDDCNFMSTRMAITPDRGVVVLGGDGSGAGAYDDRMIKFSSSGSIVYDKNLNNLSGDGFNNPFINSFPVVDANGTVIVVSAADSATAWPMDRYLIVRTFDNSSGNQTIIYKSSDDQILDPNAQDKFATISYIDVQDGTVYFLTCKSDYAYYCSGTQSVSLSKVNDSSLDDAYPRSELTNSSDFDGDGVSVNGEASQGTSEHRIDSDNDGLNDLVESVYYTQRTAAFCKVVNSTPANCAYPDPIKKDIFIEIDWLYDSEEGRSTLPSPNQLSKIGEAFAAKDIKVHFDIGDYTGNEDDEVSSSVQIGDFGGGNEVPYRALIQFDSSEDGALANVPDLIDYKKGNEDVYNITSQFNYGNRGNIWRYFLSAKVVNIPSNANDDPVHGKAVVGNDEAIIAYDMVEANTLDSADFNRILPKVFAHELGHQLCLSGLSGTSSNTFYSEQIETCAFAGVDSDSASTNYKSIMNYDILEDNIYETVNDPFPHTDRLLYPLPAYSFSEGNNGSGDHDDWNSVLNSVGDFAKDKDYYYLLPPINTPCRMECN